MLQQSTEGDDYYETQYEILRGRGLARRTIEALDIWSHPAFNAPPSFSLSGFLMTPVYIVVRWLEPPGRVEAPTPEADETNAQTGVIDEFLGGLGVEPIRFSRLVDLRFTSSDPVLTASAANALAEQYIRQNIEFRSSTTKEASEFLADQLVEQRSKLEASERALQEYRERTDSVSLEARQSIVVQKLQELNAAVTRADTVRIQKESAYNQVKDVLDNPAAIDSLPSLLSNAFVQQQKTELAQLQRQRAQLSEKLGPNHPEMVKIGLAIQNAEARIQSEVGQLVQSMRGDYEAAVAEERTLTNALNRQKQEAQQFNRTGIQYGVLQRDAAANQQMFETLMQRTQETGVSEELKSGNIRIVDAAEVPGGPSSPNILSDLLMALLSGLALAVGLAFVLEFLDDRLKNPDELKKYLGLPFLGMVPALFDKGGTARRFSAKAFPPCSLRASARFERMCSSHRPGVGAGTPAAGEPAKASEPSWMRPKA